MTADPTADEDAGLRLAVTHAAVRPGDERAPVVVWVHGYTMDSRIWERVWPLLPGFRHVGVDLPGHGRSSALLPQTRMRDIAGALAGVLRAEGAERVVALSLGTMVAFEVAIARLHPLARLAVVAPALVGMPAAAGTVDQYRRLIALRAAGAPPRRLVDAWMAAPPDIFTGLAAVPEAFAALRDVVAEHSWAELGVGGPIAFYRDPQAVEALPGSADRLLVVSGGQDMPEFRALAGRIRAQVPDARSAHVEDAGHLPLLERPEPVVAELADFLR